MGVKSKQLVRQLGLLTAEQKARYYTICMKADSRLKERNLGPLNMEQCQYICESIKNDQKVTWGGLRKLSSRHRTVTNGETSEPDLFGSSATAS